MQVEAGIVFLIVVGRGHRSNVAYFGSDEGQAADAGLLSFRCGHRIDVASCNSFEGAAAEEG